MSLNIAFSVKNIHFDFRYVDNRDCVFLEYKKARQEIKKKSSDTLKLQKKAKKGTCFILVLLKTFCAVLIDKDWTAIGLSVVIIQSPVMYSWYVLER